MEKSLYADSKDNDVEEEDQLDKADENSKYEPTQSQFFNFVYKGTGQKQLRAYFGLPEVSDMSKLRYYFDGRKIQTPTNGQSKEDWVKEQFRLMMTLGMSTGKLSPNGNAIFEAIWANVPLRISLLGNLNQAYSKNEFGKIINNINSEFYNFINIK